MTRSSRYTLGAALALVLVTNGVVLSGVYVNRAGEPDAVVTLTERELPLPMQHVSDVENSGLSLQLRWRVMDERARFETPAGIPLWLDRRKLAELGFDTTSDPASGEGKRRYEKMLPRHALLVLEYDGDTFHRQLDLDEQHLQSEQAAAKAHPGNVEFARRVALAQLMLERERTANSRLFIVDAGTDHAALRERYPDRSRFLIMSGEVRLLVKPEGNTLTGIVDGLDVKEINVPLVFRQPLDALMKGRTSSMERRTSDLLGAPPRYGVTLKTGRRLEPWIADVKSTQG